MNRIDLDSLTPEQESELLRRLEEKRKIEAEQKKSERDIYKETVAKTVTETMKELQQVSSYLSKAKALVFNNFSTLLQMKKELYGYKQGQQSHTFTNELGQSIEVGYRITDAWDDTADAGISKVNEYIDSLATNEETAKLVKFIQNLLKKDAKGNLKANRVLELRNLAESVNSELFSDGVNIIQQSYKPAKSAYFIEANFKDETGSKCSVPLSITSADFPEGTEINLTTL